MYWKDKVDENNAILLCLTCLFAIFKGDCLQVWEIEATMLLIETEPPEKEVAFLVCFCSSTMRCPSPQLGLLENHWKDETS